MEPRDEFREFGEPVEEPGTLRRAQDEAPFYPDHLFKEAVVALAVIAGLILLAVYWKLPTEELADPMDNTYVPRPEWYFLWLFQLLWYFKGGTLEVLGIVGLPLAIGLVLILLPFLDRGPERHPRRRPWATLGATAAISALTWFSVQGLQAPAPTAGPVKVASPQGEIQLSASAQTGFQLYQDQGCAACHTIAGAGGTAGPDLSRIGAERDPEWLHQFIREPKSLVAGATMPPYDLPHEELDALVDYLSSLGGQGAEVVARAPTRVIAPTTEQPAAQPPSPTPPPESAALAAPELFERLCIGCHRLDGRGSPGGPNLSAVGTYRDAAWLRQAIEDPQTVIPGAQMPGFAGTLSPAEIQALAEYLATQRNTRALAQPATTPTPAPVSFQRDIAPILEAACLQCHGDQQTYGDFDVRSYRSLMYTGQHQPVVIPENSEQSLLYLTLIDAAEEVDRMPMSGLLSAEAIQRIREWIDQGAPAE